MPHKPKIISNDISVKTITQPKIRKPRKNAVSKETKPEVLEEINDLDISSDNFKLFLENKKKYLELNLKLENLRLLLEETEKEKDIIVEILLNCVKKSKNSVDNLLFLPKRLDKDKFIKPIIHNSSEEEIEHNNTDTEDI
jgi:hypothetical protein